jgi:predicted NBD/HSP70 family sugar kinase
VTRSPGAGQVARTLRQVAGEVADGSFRLAVVSAADPVARDSGRLVELPDSPFLLGELDAPAVLAELVDGQVTVDNDVNWAARAEHSHGGATGVRDFVYLFLGEGLGCAVLTDGEVRRGHGGLAGEIAYVVTVGPDGVAMRLTDVFGALGLRRSGTAAIDVPALLRAIESDTDVRTTVGRAVAGALSAVVALTDPAVVLVGGPWGRHPTVLAAVVGEFAHAPLHVPVEAAAVSDEPSLTAARDAALEQLREAIVKRSSRPARR